MRKWRLQSYFETQRKSRAQVKTVSQLNISKNLTIGREKEHAGLCSPRQAGSLWPCSGPGLGAVWQPRPSISLLLKLQFPLIESRLTMCGELSGEEDMSGKVGLRGGGVWNEEEIRTTLSYTGTKPD